MAIIRIGKPLQEQLASVQSNDQIDNKINEQKAEKEQN